MRNGQNKRMRGRNRKGGYHQNPLSRMYESNGPDVKIRGTASHVAEKYLQLARDAQSSGRSDRRRKLLSARRTLFPLDRRRPGAVSPGPALLSAAAGRHARQSCRRLIRRWRGRATACRRRAVRAARAAAVLSRARSSSNRSRNISSRARSTCRRRQATRTSTGCRHSLPAASRHTSSRRNRARRRPAPTAMTANRIAFRCIAAAAGIAARATIRCPARVIRRCPPGRARSTIEAIARPSQRVAAPRNDSALSVRAAP